MSTLSATPALIQLGDGVYICNPVSPNPVVGAVNGDTKEGYGVDDSEVQQALSSSIPPPTIILLFTWMGAKLPHILKYVQAYNELYPSSTLIVVRSEASFFWSSEKAKKAYLTPVIQALEILGCLPTTKATPLTALSPAMRAAKIERILGTPTPRVLVHTFSNGGSWQLTTLSSLLSQSHPHELFPNSPPQPSAVVLDSCPGNGGASKTIAAFSSAIRSPVLRAVVALAIRGLFLSFAVHTRVSTLLHALRLLFRRVTSSKASPAPPTRHPQTMIDILKATLSTPDLLPWLTAATPRLYMYSPLDDMIPAEEVEAHAADTERRGLRVRRERFEESGHVAHARMYPERYWGAVADIWRTASGAGEVLSREGSTAGAERQLLE